MKAPYLVKIVDRWQADWQVGNMSFPVFLVKLSNVVDTLEQEADPNAQAVKQLWNQLELINAYALDEGRAVSPMELAEINTVLVNLHLLLGGTADRQGNPLENCRLCIFVEPCLGVFLDSILNHIRNSLPSVMSRGGWCEEASEEGSIHASLDMSLNGVVGCETGQIIIDISIEGSRAIVKTSSTWDGHVIWNLKKESTETLSSPLAIRGWVRRNAEEVMVWISSHEDSLFVKYIREHHRRDPPCLQIGIPGQ